MRVRLIVVVAAVAFGLPACSSGATRAPSTDHVSHVVRDAPHGVPVDRHLVALYDAISGTAQQRSAAAYLDYHHSFAAYSRCLRLHRGHGYRFLNPWRDYRSDGAADDTKWLAPLNNPVITREAAALAPVQQAAGRRDAAPPTFATTHCQSTIRHRRSTDVTPTNYLSLVGAFHGMLDQIDSGLRRFSSDYQSCMHDRGYDVADYPALLASIRRIVPADLQFGDGPDHRIGPGRDHAVSYEHHALAADAHCRTPAYAAGRSLLDPAIVQFERDHADELRSALAQWRVIVGEANRAAGRPRFGHLHFAPPEDD